MPLFHRESCHNFHPGLVQDENNYGGHPRYASVSGICDFKHVDCKCEPEAEGNHENSGKIGHENQEESL